MSSPVYVHIAREAIRSRLEGSSLDKTPFLSASPILAENGAAFVTLTLHGRLRGCIGSLIAHRPLIDDLIANAQSAAFRDPRFPPLSPDEFEEIEVEVSLLSPPQPLSYRDSADLRTMIRPGTDGVILRHGNYQATFLPQVWEELSDFDTFFAHLGMKAGLGNNPLSYHPEVYVYQVEKFSEEV
ncbi:MAG: AmmeMemoRadiSam system protein A [Campylobacterales bacterium]|nr:AmmeMemoRadiSam system protein A [Campylobacterales bacterium]